MSKPKSDFNKQKSSNAWTTSRLKTLFGQLHQLEKKLGSWLEVEKNHNTNSNTLKTMHEFVVNQDLKLVRELIPDNGHHNRGETSVLVLKNLQPFFTAGFLLDSKVNSCPKLNELFYRGVLFSLPHKGLPYAKTLPKISPLEVKAMNAHKWLNQSHLDFLKVDLDSQAFLIQPLPQISYVLVSEIPQLWREEHVRHAYHLINNSFDQLNKKDSFL